MRGSNDVTHERTRCVLGARQVSIQRAVCTVTITAEWRLGREHRKLGQTMPEFWLLRLSPLSRNAKTINAQSTAAIGRGCVKTQNRPLETASKIGDFSVEVSCLLTARYRLVSQSIASHVVFEGDFWGEKVVEF